MQLAAQQVSFTKTSTTSTRPSGTEKQYLQKLTVLMEQEKLYRHPQLSRELVAERLSISPGYLSQQINAHSQLNFSTFIIQYRVNDVKQKLVNPDFDNYSLLSIGMEAGFQSKSSFYAAFKKVTGMTPTAYKKQQLSS